MKIIQTPVYTFDELSDEAKEKAREWWREGFMFDHEPTYEDAKQCFALCGFEIKNIYYSGFWSQGDGACFEGSWRAANVQPGKLKEHAPQDEELHRIAAECERIAAAFPNASLSVKHRGHYYHEHCTDFTVSITDQDDNEIDTPERTKTEDDLIEVAQDAMRWIYRQLEKEWEWQNADEQIDECLQDGQYTFTAVGKRFG